MGMDNRILEYIDIGFTVAVTISIWATPYTLELVELIVTFDNGICLAETVNPTTLSCLSIK